MILLKKKAQLSSLVAAFPFTTVSDFALSSELCGLLEGVVEVVELLAVDDGDNDDADDAECGGLSEGFFGW